MTIGLFTYNPSSFIIHFTNGAEEIVWNDIESVFAYKVDWFAFDDVHINLIVKVQSLTFMRTSMALIHSLKIYINTYLA